MFKYISEILKSFTPAQRLMALLILVCSIVIITLGPSFIDSNTTNCDELNIRVKSQETQIIELNKRVNELNTNLINSQKECTDNLITKQKEIIEIVNGMIKEVENTNKIQKLFGQTRRPAGDGGSDGGNGLAKMEMSPPPTIIDDNNSDDMLKKLKSMKSKIQKKLTN